MFDRTSLNTIRSPSPGASGVTQEIASVEINKVLKNTYALLSATLLFSALTAGVAIVLKMPYLGIWITLGIYFGLLFLTSRFRNSGFGIESLDCYAYRVCMQACLLRTLKIQNGSNS